MTGRAWSHGLILMDGCTQQGLGCQEGELYFSKRAKSLQSPVTQWTQRLGLRRWLQMASSYEGLLLPTGPPDAVERAKQQGLTDSVFFAQSEAAVRTPAIMKQLKQNPNNNLPAVYISSDSKAPIGKGRTKVCKFKITTHRAPRTPQLSLTTTTTPQQIPRCLIKLSRESLKRFFKNSIFIQSLKHDHIDMVNDVDSVVAALDHIKTAAAATKKN